MCAAEQGKLGVARPASLGVARRRAGHVDGQEHEIGRHVDGIDVHEILERRERPARRGVHGGAAGRVSAAAVQAGTFAVERLERGAAEPEDEHAAGVS
jgi:hypothetical protein